MFNIIILVKSVGDDSDDDAPRMKDIKLNSISLIVKTLDPM